MKRLVAVAAASSLALGAAGIAAFAAPAGAQAATVSITVSMDLAEFCTDGPLVFQVTDVTIGAGPELTGDAGEITSNPCDWGGAVSVDVDPDTKQITVATTDVNSFQTAIVEVTYAGIDSISTVSDDLWEPAGSESGCTMAPAVPSITAGGVTVAWGLAPDCGVEGSATLASEGASVFTWGGTAPTTTTVSPTTAPPAVEAAVVTPAFTG